MQVTVTGSGFISSSTVQWNGNTRPTTYVNATQLTAALTASDLASAGTGQITVVNPVPGGGTSGAATFTINNPTPVVTSATPSSILAGSAATTVSITGTGFVASSVVQWNDAARTATFVSSTQLQIGLTASDLATGGSATLTVINPGAAASRCVDFTIN